MCKNKICLYNISMLSQTKKCLKDKNSLDKSCTNVGNYRIPKNSDYKKINHFKISR